MQGAFSLTVFEFIMNRSNYFDTIEEKINALAERIKSRSRLNLLNLNIHSENFYFQFLNRLFGWKTQNVNAVRGNVEGIDLIDHQNKIIVQVSSTNTKRKIEKSLEKDIIKQHSSYRFKFVSIARDCDNLKKASFANPHNCLFDPVSDIIDKHFILSHVLQQDITVQKELCSFILEELGNPVEELVLESTIAELINFLHKNKPTNASLALTVDAFDIDSKIQFNGLELSREIIEEHSVYYSSISSKYEIYDREGINKSRSVLHAISRFYRLESIDGGDPNRIFLNIVDKVADFARGSGSFILTTKEILQLSAEILTVDTFLRCKIFKNPPNRATT